MSAPKSDTSTIEARKNRLLELLSEGRSQASASEILRRENYPADLRTVQRDVRSLRGQWGEANINQYELLREQQLHEVEEDKAELRALRDKLVDFVDPREVIEWALKIIDRRDAIRQTEIKLTGTAAPTKSIHASVNADGDPAKLVGYRKFLYHTRHLSEEDVNRLVYPFCDSLPPTPSEPFEPTEDMRRGYCLEGS